MFTREGPTEGHVDVYIWLQTFSSQFPQWNSAPAPNCASKFIKLEEWVMGTSNLELRSETQGTTWIWDWCLSGGGVGGSSLVGLSPSLERSLAIPR